MNKSYLDAAKRHFVGTMLSSPVILRAEQVPSDVARIANELQRQAPGLCRTEALKIAERAIPATL